MKKIFHMDHCGQELLPEWYWKRGLHDACIVKMSVREFAYDPMRRASNCVELIIDASQAMFDTTIRTIKFFNCNILTPGIDIAGMWWIRDSLHADGEKYVLEIDLGSAKNQCNFVLRFSACEIERSLSSK